MFWHALLLCSLLLGTQGEYVLMRHGLPPPGKPDASAKAVQTKWVDQLLDNNNPSSARWRMRYMSNDQFFTPGSPLFIMIGGEWEISPGYLLSGHMYEVARQHSGYMVYSEHRFYGQSMPTRDLSLANLRYLTSEQALADLAHLVEHLRDTVPGLENSKVVVFGGSYSGNLATWFRLLYPDVCDIAMGSSGPVMAAVDFYEYHEAVGRSLATVSPNCPEQLSRGINAVLEKLNTGSGGVSTVSRDFRWCSSVRETNDYYVFFKSIANMFAGVVQYAQGDDLNRVCSELTSVSDPYESLKRFVTSRSGSCMSISYTGLRDYYRSTAISADISRQWLFQTCNEFGYIQSSSSDLDPFANSFPPSMELQLCQDVFGNDFTPENIQANVDESNRKYGAKNPPTTRVLTIHGQIDPWHRLGIVKDISPEMPARLIKVTSHCADLNMGNTSGDMLEAQKMVRDKIAEWLNE